jgi:hypothetical protein
VGSAVETTTTSSDVMKAPSEARTSVHLTLVGGVDVRAVDVGGVDVGGVDTVGLSVIAESSEFCRDWSIGTVRRRFRARFTGPFTGRFTGWFTGPFTGPFRGR